MPKIIDREKFYTAVRNVLGDVNTISRKQVFEVCNISNVEVPFWLMNDPNNRTIQRAVYKLRKNKQNMNNTETENMSVANMAVTAVSLPLSEAQSFVPRNAPGYVPFGNYNDVMTIVKSKMFYPIFITGLSGNGKTLMVEQIHAVTGREVIRVNITIETDEDDLLGGFRLVDGRTVWQNGPVIHAMERGATLLLDEVDLGSNKLMCLQPVLEGISIFLKKINKLITVQPGFNIIATANTKGKGSDDGRFVGTNVLNEAFLERFSITLEQEYPSAKVEAKILKNVLARHKVEDNDFVSKLVAWADVVRKTFHEGACNEIISTRRLVHICEAFFIFGQNRMKSIELCLNRFDNETKKSFVDLYKKLDESIDNKNSPAVEEISPAPNETVECPF